MSSPQILDLATLLAPIPGNYPAGESLFYTDTYDIIKEARRADDTLEQGEWQRDIKTADWPAVIALTTAALATHSKDLQIASWLVEALVQRHHFAGLRDGLRLLQGLHAHFWEGLYPAREDGDLEDRVVVLECLNRVLPFAIRHTPVTSSPWLKPGVSHPRGEHQMLCLLRRHLLTSPWLKPGASRRTW